MRSPKKRKPRFSPFYNHSPPPNQPPPQKIPAAFSPLPALIHRTAARAPRRCGERWPPSASHPPPPLPPRRGSILPTAVGLRRRGRGRGRGRAGVPPPPVRTLLIDNYDSYTYNIFQELSVVNGGEPPPRLPSRETMACDCHCFCSTFPWPVFFFPVPPVVVRNDEWTWRDVYRWVYKERAFDNIVISPGPGSPACPSDIGEHLHFSSIVWNQN